MLFHDEKYGENKAGNKWTKQINGESGSTNGIETQAAGFQSESVSDIFRIKAGS